MDIPRPQKHIYMANILIQNIMQNGKGEQHRAKRKPHHKFHGSWFGNNSHAKFTFYRFIWHRHECHSSNCIVWTLMLCTFFWHKCCMPICIVYTWCYMFIPIIYTQKSCKQFPCLNNAWHSCLNNMNPWNDRFHIDLEWTHGVYKFVMLKNLNVVERATKTMRRDKTGRQIGRGPCNALTGPDNQTHLGLLLWLHPLILSHIF
jgi:hypothetical protein